MNIYGKYGIQKTKKKRKRKKKERKKRKNPIKNEILSPCGVQLSPKSPLLNPSLDSYGKYCNFDDVYTVFTIHAQLSSG